jgi:excisionase family DNA binding protein
MSTGRKETRMTFDPPLSINQTASALNISRTAVYEILARGEMTAVKLNGKTLIRSTEVERYFRSLPKAKFAPVHATATPVTA